MTATQKQVKRALYNGLPNLSDRELRQMIDRELEKDSSQIDMNYIDTCFDLMEMHADGRIAVQPRRKWLKAEIVVARITAATAAEDCTPGECSIKDIFCKTNSFSFHFNTHLLQ